MNEYENAVELLKSQGKFYINLGLERVKSILEIFGNPQEKLKCIQIAGTNGKGSVATTLDAILIEAGYKTGLYTSPHIFEYTERIKVSGQEIPKEDFAKYISKIVNVSDNNDIHLTEFEILTVVMFLYFVDKNVDVAILETGLGGRLDATNIISSNLCSIITHIDLDHTERLGKTKDQIAFEKAGIIKQNCPVITSEGYEIIKDTADNKESLLLLVSPFVDKKYIDAYSLKGTNQIENLSLVIATINLLFKDIKEETIINALKKVNHICRFQYLKDKNLVIDAAHNPNGIEALNNNLNLFFPNTKRRFIFGALENKDYKKMLDELFSFSIYGDDRPEIFFYNFSENSCKFEELQEACIYYSKPFKSIEDINFTDDTLTIICGSIYMISKLIKKEWLL